MNIWTALAGSWLGLVMLALSGAFRSTQLAELGFAVFIASVALMWAAARDLA